jgi:hypothetical protein
MQDKLQKAICNNNDLYEAILGSQDINSHKTDSIWYSLEKTPPFYSNLVTVSKEWKPDDVFRKINFNYKRENWEEWTIKDSFAVLDLTEFGFTKLFDAQWMYLESVDFIPTKNSENLHYEIVDKEEILSAWRLVWDSDDQIGKAVFNPKLLNNPKVYIVAGYKDAQIVSGCFVNKTGNVLGISNFFAPDKDVYYWSDVISFIHDSVECLDVVGYERNELVDKLHLLGFESIGNLTVWHKKT